MFKFSFIDRIVKHWSLLCTETLKVRRKKERKIFLPLEKDTCFRSVTSVIPIGLLLLQFVQSMHLYMMKNGTQV